ncbi:MAG: PAS domain-containing protein [Candidatus Wolfebacteria bacterium]|nr:PAS domain-containing protein [Candidatus Wolfebacteria bacterium]
METTKDGISIKQIVKPVGADFVERLWEKSWTYIKTVVDVVREPVLILDKDFRVMTANESFYRTFQVERMDTEGKVVYELGNGQWNIPALKKLLEDILPENTFFKGFEVIHEFPFIGRKVMILNARQIHFKEDSVSEMLPPIILLAIEDVTEIMAVAETLAGHANQLEAKLIEQTKKLEIHIGGLEKEIKELKQQP